MANLEEAKHAAYMFGAEAIANSTKFGADDRYSIAWYYFRKKEDCDWVDISLDHRQILIAEFRRGKQAEHKARKGLF